MQAANFMLRFVRVLSAEILQHWRVSGDRIRVRAEPPRAGMECWHLLFPSLFSVGSWCLLDSGPGRVNSSHNRNERV